MRKSYDKNGRTLYKFSHSVSQGGNVYMHKGAISNKEGLRNALQAIAAKLKLINPTIKVYDDIFFFFFHVPKAVAPAAIIDSIQKNIEAFATWDKEYVFTGVYDLQEKYVRKDLQQWGCDFDKG